MQSFAAFVFQTLVAAALCYFLWQACRRITRPRDATSIVISIGFLVRALLGQALYWISYLRLPFGRSMQAGDGVWFYALDGLLYRRLAMDIARDGAHAFFNIPNDHTSPAWIQFVNLLSILVGWAMSVSILVNCASYLCISWAILRLARRNRTGPAALFAITALSFLPSGVLWSIQPLKDAAFAALLALAALLVGAWEDFVERDRSVATFVVLAAATMALTWAITGIRWYAGIALTLALPAGVITLLARTSHRTAAAVSGVLLASLTWGVLVMEGTSLFPKGVAHLVRPWHSTAALPATTLDSVNRLRDSFDEMSGATTIQAGRHLATLGAAAKVKFRTVDSRDVPPPLVENIRGHLRSRPSTIQGRVLAGTAAMFLPRFVGERLGILRIEGGRGMWLIAEIDTVMSGIICLTAFALCARSFRRGGRLTPPFIVCAVMTAAIALPMTYSVGNFGTLFRLRYIVFVEIALLPVLVGDRRKEQGDLPA